MSLRSSDRQPGTLSRPTFGLRLRQQSSIPHSPVLYHGGGACHLPGPRDAS